MALRLPRRSLRPARAKCAHSDPHHLPLGSLFLVICFAHRECSRFFNESLETKDCGDLQDTFASRHLANVLAATGGGVRSRDNFRPSDRAGPSLAMSRNLIEKAHFMGGGIKSLQPFWGRVTAGVSRTYFFSRVNISKSNEKSKTIKRPQFWRFSPRFSFKPLVVFERMGRVWNRRRRSPA